MYARITIVKVPKTVARISRNGPITDLAVSKSPEAEACGDPISTIVNVPFLLSRSKEINHVQKSI